ncbi:NTP transferase domain-containing protein [Candidatus Williamhamiltonella defendens]|uniref:phosphocholine cytidylyltransferase family protein n=1 Tax=Candidatus Williamhamiltonella defendens TaxID=138072 RepID=UPI0002E4F4AD|nr:phosphocholine cytidylyltransferase family protein [Candidatus Hamiltonella defensa]
MRAVILAAGRGLRLQQPKQEQIPKCLLQFDGKTLLERHLILLKSVGVYDVTIALGFRHELIEAEIKRLNWQPSPETFVNSSFDLGSVLTVHTVTDAVTRGGDVLLMDADVLCDIDILSALVANNQSTNRLLIDYNFEEGEEPVKLCIRDGIPVELRKKLSVDLKYDTVGESVGFFRFDESAAQRFATIVREYIDSNRAHMPHEEAVRDLLQEYNHIFEVRDITGAPWMEIDFPKDIIRAKNEILPQLKPLLEVV